MDAYIGSFSKLAGAVKAPPTGAEDYFDRLNYVITPAILLVIATIVGMKQYVFQAIQCWNIQELDSSRMEYAENYCWVENTYHYDSADPMPHNGDPAKGRTIHYYQWVPFILMSQAAMFYIPHLVWLVLSSNTEVDMQRLAEQSRELQGEVDEEKRRMKVAFLSSSVKKFLSFRKQKYRNKSCCKRVLSVLFGKPAFAMYLVFAYIIAKILYIGNCVLQLYLMRTFLGLDMTMFGLKLFSDIANNRTWHTTKVFPRVTYCSFWTRAVGPGHPYTLQCVLPVNMLNEKFYILIWFWVMIILALNVFSLIRISMRLLFSPRRRAVVKKYLKIAESMLQFKRDPSIEPKFVNDFLKTDGAFLLSIISKSAGDITATDIVVDSFTDWAKDYKRPITSKLYDDEHDGVAV